LFLQILDAGGVRDNYLDEIVSFEDTIIVFTSNAGRNLYEESEKDNLATLPKKVVIDAIKKDTKIGTKDPAFPEALISRFSAGNVIMFNKLRTQDFIKIAEKEFVSAQKTFKDKLDVEVSLDKKMPFAILFSEY
jgi:ATP-dependent Clp protease ATP-binding subunit ClpA